MKNISKNITYIGAIAIALFVVLGIRSVHAQGIDCWTNQGPYWMNCDLQNGNNGNNNGNNGANNNSNYLNVNTLSATSVDEDSATLRGEITNLNSNYDYERYFEWGTSSGNLNHSLYLSGTTDDEGTFSRSLSGLDSDRTYYFRACADRTTSSEHDCGSTRNFRTDDDGNYNSNNNNNNYSNASANVITTEATGITTTGAILNGVVINDGGSQTVWFEWGPSVALGSTTSTSVVSGDQSTISVQLYGLVPNQTYFFRLASNNGDRGDFKAFITNKTAGTTGTSTGTSTGGTNTNTGSNTNASNSGQYLDVGLEASAKEVVSGDQVSFEVLYENLTSTVIRNTSIVVDFPKEIVPVKTEFGTINGQKLTIFVPEITAKQKVHFTVNTEINGKFKSESFLVSVIEATFDNPKADNSTISVNDYLIIKAGPGGNSQSANALFAGTFFPHTFLGWLILTLLIGLIIFFALAYRRKQEDKKETLKIAK